VAHILAGHQKDHLTTDVLGMAADALKGPQRQHDIDHQPHLTMVLHNEGEKTSQTDYHF
jgi:hypothetical protein